MRYLTWERRLRTDVFKLHCSGGGPSRVELTHCAHAGSASQRPVSVFVGGGPPSEPRQRQRQLRTRFRGSAVGHRLHWARRGTRPITSDCHAPIKCVVCPRQIILLYLTSSNHLSHAESTIADCWIWPVHCAIPRVPAADFASNPGRHAEYRRERLGRGADGFLAAGQGSSQSKPSSR
jgi:hypothetical protein